MSWARWEFASIVFLGIDIVALIITSGLAPTPAVRHALVDIEIDLLVLVTVFGLVLTSIMRSRATKRENAAGYTTEWNRLHEYWQLDERSGEVIRRPVATRLRSKETTTNGS